MKLNLSNFKKYEIEILQLLQINNVRFLNRGRCCINQFGWNDNKPGLTTDIVLSLVKKELFKVELSKSLNDIGDNKFIIVVSVPISAITDLLNGITIDTTSIHNIGIANNWKFY